VGGWGIRGGAWKDAGRKMIEGPGADWPVASCHIGLIDDSAMALVKESFILFFEIKKNTKVGSKL